MHSRLSAAALAALLCFAAPIEAKDDASVMQDDAIVVTASRSEQRVREAIAHTTVLTAQDIRDSGAVDLPALLRREAGFEFSQNGGVGTTSSTFLRGAATNQVLVLVDGVRVSSLTTGATQIDQLMLDHIERVEIVRGNVSSLYGSGAIGGVIQVFTRQGRGAPRASVDIGAGGEGTRRLRADYSGEIGATRFSLNVSRFDTDGFSALRSTSSPTANPDRDGYRNESISGGLSHRFAAGHEAGIRFLSSRGKVEFDNAFAARITDLHDGRTQVESVVAYTNNQLASRWLSRLAFSGGKDRFDNATNGVTTSRTRTRNSQLTWQNDVVLAPEHTLMLGLEILRQGVASTTAYVRSGRDVDALFLGYRGRVGRHALQLNLRSEDYSDFGRANTHFAGYGYDLGERWRIVASGSRAFRAPTFNELFFPGFGNASLRPERSRSVEAGLQYAAGPHLARAVAFRSRITDLINPFPVVNVNRAEIDGMEFSYRGSVAGFDLRASLTLQDPMQIAAGVQSQLIRRAKSFGSLAVGRSFGPWRLGAEILASEKRFDNHITAFPARRERLAGYEVVNLTAAYRLGAASSIQARLENVFDADYELTHGYHTQGRKLTAALRHAF